MSYNKKVWKSGDRITKEALNNMENGIEAAHQNSGGSGTSYDDTAIRNDITGIKTDLGTEELTTTAKNVKGAVNEVAAQYKDSEKQILENKYLINVLSLGVKNDGTVDCTDIIHKALSEGKSLFFPKGSYLLEYLKLKSKYVLVGENEQQTKLLPKTSNKESFITINSGACNNIRFENFSIGKSPNSGQVCIDIVANFPPATEYQHGGLWDSTFKNIYVTNSIEASAWDGVGMRLIGSGNNSQLPIQLNIFEKINIWVNNKSNINNIPLVIEGQVEQNLFSRCTFSGIDNEKTITDLNNVSALFRRRRNSDGSIDGDAGGGQNTFLQCYFGNTAQCISFERSRNPCFINCYFENATKLAFITMSSKVTFVAGITTNVNGAEYMIDEGAGENQLYITSIMLNGKINVRLCLASNSNVINMGHGETSITDGNININAIYSIQHKDTANDVVINNLNVHSIFANENTLFFLFPAEAGKTVEFSSTGGNIYNSLTVDCNGKACLIKATKIPYLQKYKLEQFGTL